MYVSGAHIPCSVHTYNIGSLFYLTNSICHLLQVLQCVCVCVCAARAWVCGWNSHQVWSVCHKMFTNPNTRSTISGPILCHNSSIPISTYFFMFHLNVIPPNHMHFSFPSHQLQVPSNITSLTDLT
jgi:hypothetical protein